MRSRRRRGPIRWRWIEAEALAEHPSIRRLMSAGDPSDLESNATRWWAAARATVSMAAALALVAPLVGRRGHHSPSLDVALVVVGPIAAVVAVVLAVELALWLRRGRPRDGLSASSSAMNLAAAAVVTWAVLAVGSSLSPALAVFAGTAAIACLVVSALWVVLRWLLPERWSAPGESIARARRDAQDRAAALEALEHLDADERAAIRERRDRAVGRLASMGLIDVGELAWARSAPLGLLEEHMAMPPSSRVPGAVAEPESLPVVAEPVVARGSRRYRTEPRYWLLIGALGGIVVAGMLATVTSSHPVVVLLAIVVTIGAAIALLHPLRSLSTELAMDDDWLMVRGADERDLLRSEIVATSVEPGGDLLALLVHGAPRRPLAHPVLRLEHGGVVALRAFAAPVDEALRLSRHLAAWVLDRSAEEA